MGDFTLYLRAITTLLPVFSAFSCGVIAALSIGDSLSLEEKKLKKITTSYMALAALGWFVTFCYGYYHVAFVILNALCMFTFTLLPVLFYRIIHFMARSKQEKHFSLLHYLPPVILAIAMLAWSFFIPFDVQLDIVKGKGQVVAAGYETYTAFFASKPTLRALFGIVYYALIVVLLFDYYKKACNPASLVRKPAKWIFFLVAISVAAMLSSIFTTFMSRNELFVSGWTLVAAVGIVAQHILLTYHIIQRKYVLYAVFAEGSTVKSDETQEKGREKPARRYHSGKITKPKLEAFMRREKPYLRPDFKLIDLAGMLNVNRTVMSRFINEEFGVNFNSYINEWRLKEMKRLCALASHKGLSVGGFATRAGFSDLRQYYRVVSRKRQDKYKINTTPTTKRR